jgi:hypothetical protein
VLTINAFFEIILLTFFGFMVSLYQKSEKVSDLNGVNSFVDPFEVTQGGNRL